MIFYFLYCSIDCKYEYFCTTGNKSSKCFSQKKNILFYNIVSYIIIYFYIILNWFTF